MDCARIRVCKAPSLAVNTTPMEEIVDNPDSATWYDNPRHWRYKAQKQLSKYTNGLIKSPFYISYFKWQKEQDEESQDNSLIPQDQTANFLAVTTVEYYSPSCFYNLINGISKLQETKNYSRSEKIEQLVKGYRGSIGSSIEMYLYANGNESFASVGHLTDMPAFFKNARATIINISPSLTAIVITFYLRKSFTDDLTSLIHQRWPEGLAGVA